jgi:tetratricopeptide (TPR) repeat protein
MGHETKQDIEKLNRLENDLKNEYTNPIKMFEVAILYIEPFHKEDKAIILLKNILDLEPQNELAKIWLSFCYLHYLMDKDSLFQAEELLKSIISNQNSLQMGAAKMLLAETLDDLNKVTWSQKAKLLEQSVSLEPTWVKNRYNLAFTYKQLGKLSEAIAQIDLAIKNIIIPAAFLKDSEILYEESITGRFSKREFLQKIKKRFLTE